MQSLQKEVTNLSSSDRPINLRDARLLVRCFNGPSVFQTFSDNDRTKITRYDPVNGAPGDHDVKKKRRVVDPLAGVLAGKFKDLQLELMSRNARGAGVFFAVQCTDGIGRELANFVEVQAIAIDQDNGTPDKPYPIPPSLLVESSPGKYQIYWLLADGETITQSEHSGIMRRLVAEWKADPRATDLMRVMRVPGFWHLKREPFQVRLLNADEIRESGCCVYTADEIRDAFPPIEPPPRTKRFRLVGGTASIGSVRSALLVIADKPSWVSSKLTVASDYETWWQIGLALYREFGDDGLPLFHEFSQQTTAYDEASVEEKWASFSNGAERDDGVTVGTIFHFAKQCGWSAFDSRYQSAIHTLRAQFASL